ncbi:unnamed protein product, partial [Rotaria magnacalcarata]
MSKKAISGRGNQAYALASAPIYDEWVRNNYEVQVWQSYLKLATEKKHWAKEVIQRTKRPTTTAIKNHIREPVDRIEKYILDYIHFCTQHVKKMAQTRIQLAKAQMDEFKTLEDFEQIATPAQWNIHLILKPKIKLWSTKNKNYKILTKRVELELL